VTARPEPRTTASASRRSLNSAQPAERSRTGISEIVPAGSPACCRAGSSEVSQMAWAVASASDPMRSTAVLPVATTPAASASTLGRPSKTKAITPSGAVTMRTFQSS